MTFLLAGDLIVYLQIMLNKIERTIIDILNVETWGLLYDLAQLSRNIIKGLTISIINT